jgi:hypothetical protein
MMLRFAIAVGPEIGLGHLRRMQVLAQAVMAAGCEAALHVNVDSEGLRAEGLRAEGLRAAPFVPPPVLAARDLRFGAPLNRSMIDANESD